jgi:hypothetical protein
MGQSKFSRDYLYVILISTDRFNDLNVSSRREHQTTVGVYNFQVIFIIIALCWRLYGPEVLASFIFRSRLSI